MQGTLIWTVCDLIGVSRVNTPFSRGLSQSNLIAVRRINVICIRSPRSFVEASHTEEFVTSITAKNRVKDRLRNRVKERFSE